LPRFTCSQPSCVGEPPRPQEKQRLSDCGGYSACLSRCCSRPRAAAAGRGPASADSSYVLLLCVGLPSICAHCVAYIVSQEVCKICFEPFPVQDMLSARCKHFYCKVRQYGLEWCTGGSTPLCDSATSRPVPLSETACEASGAPRPLTALSRAAAVHVLAASRQRCAGCPHAAAGLLARIHPHCG
jgi:hypothetical protein